MRPASELTPAARAPTIPQPGQRGAAAPHFGPIAASVDPGGGVRWLPAPALPVDGGAREPDELFSFVIIADTQLHENRCEAAPEELRAFPRAVAALRPRFVLHLGDLMHEGRHADAYPRFKRCFAELLSAIPFFPTIGNHDIDYGLGYGEFRRYLDHQLLVQNRLLVGPSYRTTYPLAYRDASARRFASPRVARDRRIVPSGQTHQLYYAFRHQNSFFISFEQGSVVEINTPIPWVEAQLQRARADKRVEHIFVYLHHPLYSSAIGELDGAVRPVRAPYEGLFRKYHVTAVFAGHAHVFDRFYVPNDGSPTRPVGAPRTAFKHDGQGIHYFTIGTSGSAFIPGDYCRQVPVLHQEESFRYLQVRGCGHNMARVVVSKHGVRIDVIGLSGARQKYTLSLWDQIRLLFSQM